MRRYHGPGISLRQTDNPGLPGRPGPPQCDWTDCIFAGRGVTFSIFSALVQGKKNFLHGPGVPLDKRLAADDIVGFGVKPRYTELNELISANAYSASER